MLLCTRCSVKGVRMSPFWTFTRGLTTAPDVPGVPAQKEALTFNDLHVHSSIWPKLPKLFGITEPSPVQRNTLEFLWRGPPEKSKIETGVPRPIDDLIIQSPTGSGKTFAFLFGILGQIDNFTPATQAVILVPTRELAVQMQNIATSLTKGGNKKRRKAHPIVVERLGGKASNDMLRTRLKTYPPHVVIGTPRMVLDLINGEVLSTSKVKWMVFDEVDFMAQSEVMRKLFSPLVKRRNNAQLILVSAWITPEVVEMAKEHLRRPRAATENGLIRLADLDESAALMPVSLPTRVVHKAFVCSASLPHAQAAALEFLAETFTPRAALVFFNNMRVVPRVMSGMDPSFKVFESVSLTSNSDRKKALRAIEVQPGVMILTTEMLARGMDVPRLTHVINMGLPRTASAYLHRAGRVGRLKQKQGTVITIVKKPGDIAKLQEMGKELGVDITTFSTLDELSEEEQQMMTHMSTARKRRLARAARAGVPRRRDRVDAVA